MPEIDKEERSRKDKAGCWTISSRAGKQNCAQWLNLRDRHTRMQSRLELSMKLSQKIISWVLCRSAVALQTPLANRLFRLLLQNAQCLDG